jgi:poly(A) polymerase
MDRKNWDALLLSKDVDLRLQELADSDELRRTFPSLQRLVGFGGGDSGHKCLWSHTKQVVMQTVPDPLLRWASLFHDVGKPHCFEIREGKITFWHHEAVSARIFRKEIRKTSLMTPQEIGRVSFIINNLGSVEAYSPEWTDSAVRRLAKELEPELDGVFAVARADCTTGNPKKRRQQMRRTAELRKRVEAIVAADATPPALPKGLGTALMAQLGLPGGPELGRLMGDLKVRVENGELPRNADISVYLDALK